ncbi:helix-turn-helix domain-containing protein [Rhodopirellula sp. MGV]|uniref:helix-turn-helix domain-containing protein n=1 Tax=Rhodopirellula sp. MGV TaxID=2023130 RepID=UPI000B96B1A7|nr:helix-turn-helix domain-containing protein [Rhodopirellula sp. MGV]OYP30000.1 hypothetical protein CGZ80_23580 [Rhodopirellula sp. MGV]PNY33453.1 hypothetical protein C2E31_28580 [Rhodopirellula baltica]
MATSTSIRPLSRLLDKTSAPLWVIGPDGKLAYLSASVGEWLSIEPEMLVGRLCVAGVSVTDDPLDYLAASLAPPPGISTRGTASLLVQPSMSGKRARQFKAMQTRFVKSGDAHEAFVFAITGSFNDTAVDTDIDFARQLRQRLDTWRQHQSNLASMSLLGDSKYARRLQRQIKLAGRLRSDVLIESPPGCLDEAIARDIHHRSAADEPVVVIDGSLMDRELLDASLWPILHHLADEKDASVIVKDIDATVPEAQQRLLEHLDEHGERLRLIGLASCATTNGKGDQDDLEAIDNAEQEKANESITSELAERFCGLRIRLVSLAARLQDLPPIASAMLNRRRAAGEGTADRFTSAALDAMVLYPWPNNFHELDQTVRHAIRAAKQPAIDLEDLPLAIRSYRPTALATESLPFDLDQTVAEFERKLILSTLDSSDGNRAEAARRMNISRARLLRKLETYEDEQP